MASARVVRVDVIKPTNSIALAFTALMSVPLLEKNIQVSVENIIAGLSVPPEQFSPSGSPCVVCLDFYFHNFEQITRELDRRAGVTLFSRLRFKHGKLLQALVSFLNSVCDWTPEQLDEFAWCDEDCPHHNLRGLEKYSDFTYSGIRGYYEGYGPLNRLIISMFLTVTQAALQQKDDIDEVIRLEKKSKKQAKWPSSPSDFIPRGATVAVAAFSEWARIVRSITPLSSLGVLTFCCPSLVPAMAQSRDFLSLVSYLFDEIVVYMENLDYSEFDHKFRHILWQDVHGLYHLFDGGWFEDLSFVATEGDEKRLTAILTHICNCIGELIMILDRDDGGIVPKSVKTVRNRLGATGVKIQINLHHEFPFPLHPVFQPWADSLTPPNDVRVGRLISNILSSRGQPFCTRVPCIWTCENTKSNFKQCGGCLVVRYCSKECQVADWAEHKMACKTLKIVLPIALEYYHSNFSGAITKNSVYGRKVLGALEEAGLTEESMEQADDYLCLHKRHARDMPWIEDLKKPENRLS